jgi:(1->4)-alpha-D-glucan 1-alpha-D-glucosylmutase
VTAGRSPSGEVDSITGIRRLTEGWPDGRIKLFVTAAGLRLRRERPAIFLSGRYVPLDVEVEPPAEIVAFARELDDQHVMVVAPRFVAGLLSADGTLPIGPVWRDARVRLRPDWPNRPLRNVLTGEMFQPDVIDGRGTFFVREVLAHCPVALLAS